MRGPKIDDVAGSVSFPDDRDVYVNIETGDEPPYTTVDIEDMPDE